MFGFCCSESCSEPAGAVEVAAVHAASPGSTDLTDYTLPEGEYNFEEAASKATIGAVFRPQEEAASPPLSRSSSQNALLRSIALDFDVLVEKGSRKIGIDMAVAKDRKAMIVAKVKAGAVQDFNSNAAVSGEFQKIVKRGDRILEVNDCGQGDTGEIMNAFKSASTSVSLKIRRILEFKLDNLPNVPTNVYGFKFAEGPKGELMFTGLEQAANKSLQPDVELREGDYVLKVNGKSGNAVELKAEIDASDVLSFRVRRGGADA